MVLSLAFPERRIGLWPPVPVRARYAPTTIGPAAAQPIRSAALLAAHFSGWVLGSTRGALGSLMCVYGGVLDRIVCGCAGFRAARRRVGDGGRVWRQLLRRAQGVVGAAPARVGAGHVVGDAMGHFRRPEARGTANEHAMQPHAFRMRPSAAASVVVLLAAALVSARAALQSGECALLLPAAPARAASQCVYHSFPFGSAAVR